MAKAINNYKEMTVSQLSEYIDDLYGQYVLTRMEHSDILSGFDSNTSRLPEVENQLNKITKEYNKVVRWYKKHYHIECREI